MGHGRFVEWPAAELVDVGVQARRDSADLVFAEPGHTHLLGYVLDFPGSGAGGVHLRDRDHERAVDPLVALDHVVREEAPGPEFRDAEREGSTHVAGDLAVSVAAVGPSAAEPVGLGVHHGVDHLFSQPATQLLHVDGPAV